MEQFSQFFWIIKNKKISWEISKKKWIIIAIKRKKDGNLYIFIYSIKIRIIRNFTDKYKNNNKIPEILENRLKNRFYIFYGFFIFMIKLG